MEATPASELAAMLVETRSIPCLYAEEAGTNTWPVGSVAAALLRWIRKTKVIPGSRLTVCAILVVVCNFLCKY